MKLAVVSILVATALTLGACSHMSETAALGSVPVTDLTADQMRAELAAISQQLSDISSMSREDVKRVRIQTRAAGLAEGKIGPAATISRGGGTLEGSVESQTLRSSMRLTKVEVLRQRQKELRAALALREQQG